MLNVHPQSFPPPHSPQSHFHRVLTIVHIIQPSLDRRNDRDSDFSTDCCMREDSRLIFRLTIPSLLTPNGDLLRDPKKIKKVSGATSSVILKMLSLIPYGPMGSWSASSTFVHALHVILVMSRLWNCTQKFLCTANHLASTKYFSGWESLICANSLSAPSRTRLQWCLLTSYLWNRLGISL